MSRRRRRRAPARLAAPAPVSAAIANELTIREPASLADIQALHYLRLVQGEEMAPAPVNPEKVMRQLIYAVQHPETHTMLLAVKGDRLVGYLLLEICEWDFSDEKFMGDFGFYVLPQFRNEDVGPALLRDAREIAAISKLPLYIAILNPRRRRGLPTGVEKVASRIGFIPQGAIYSFGKENSDVLRKQQTDRTEDHDEHPSGVAQLGEQ